MLFDESDELPDESDKLPDESEDTSVLEVDDDLAGDSSDCIGSHNTQGEESSAITTGEEVVPHGVELVNKSRSKSAVWALFGFKADLKGQPMDENRPICKLCQQPIAVKGVICFPI